MKLIILILSLLLTESCNTNKQAVTNNAKIEKENIVNIAKNSEYKTIQYIAAARASYIKIIVNKDTLNYQLSHSEKPKTRAITKLEKKELTTLIAAIDIQSLPSIKPPSKTHQYDGAAGAVLTIKTEKDSYITPTFDHGKPNTVISPLVNKLLSMIEKQ